MRDGLFQVVLPPDTVATITTLGGREHNSYGDIPDPTGFPIPYSDDFDSTLVWYSALW